MHLQFKKNLWIGIFYIENCPFCSAPFCMLRKGWTSIKIDQWKARVIPSIYSDIWLWHNTVCHLTPLQILSQTLRWLSWAVFRQDWKVLAEKRTIVLFSFFSSLQKQTHESAEVQRVLTWNALLWKADRNSCLWQVWKCEATQAFVCGKMLRLLILHVTVASFETLASTRKTVNLILGSFDIVCWEFVSCN